MLELVHSGEPVPSSLDVRVLHDKRNGSTAARQSIVRALAHIEEGKPEVDLFLVAPASNGGLMDLHFILPPEQARQLVRMVEAALQIAVLSLKEGKPDA